MTCYVYLAPGSHEEGAQPRRFKIGKSSHPRQRLASLPDAIDWDETWVVECSTEAHATKLEQHLHFMFRHFQVTPHEEDGKTEWFRMGCFNDVLDYVSRHRWNIGYQRVYHLVPLETRLRPLGDRAMWVMAEAALLLAKAEPGLLEPYLKQALLDDKVKGCRP